MNQPTDANELQTKFTSLFGRFKNVAPNPKVHQHNSSSLPMLSRLQPFLESKSVWISSNSFIRTRIASRMLLTLHSPVCSIASLKSCLSEHAGVTSFKNLLMNSKNVARSTENSSVIPKAISFPINGLTIVRSWKSFQTTRVPTPRSRAFVRCKSVSLSEIVESAASVDR